MMTRVSDSGKARMCEVMARGRFAMKSHGAITSCPIFRCASPQREDEIWFCDLCLPFVSRVLELYTISNN